MKYKKKISFLLVVIYGFLIPSESWAHKKIIEFSVPKSGTHLLSLTIEKIANIKGTGKIPDTFIPQSHSNVLPEEFEALIQLPDQYFWKGHCIYSDQYASLINNNKYTVFFIYRDPRDLLISLIFHHLEIFPQLADYNYWFKTSFHDLLLQEIVKIKKEYDDRFGWMKLKNVCVLRFEDLVGAKGGGSRTAQLKSIHKIAAHIGIQLSEAKCHEIADSLFGNDKSYTFRKGQIGQWKTYFKPEHKELFKQIAGQFLIDLGYEKDLSW